MQIPRNPNTPDCFCPNKRVMGSASDVKDFPRHQKKHLESSWILDGGPNFDAPNRAYIRIDLFKGFFIPIFTENNIAVDKDEPPRSDVFDTFLARRSPRASVDDDLDIAIFPVKAIKNTKSLVGGASINGYELVYRHATVNGF
jgi:hypothetical protein